jgi:acyl-CoA synthetase (AMP-forming)/AMP-acid ligase II
MALTHDDRAMMQFTSGSTGQPKGVLLSHRNLLANAEGVLKHTGLTPQDRLLHVMPLHHTNGINNQLIVPFLAGASVVLVERFKAESAADLIAQHRPTYMTGVPTMYSRMLAHLGTAPEDRAKLASLRFLRCGSAPITVALHEQIEAAFGVPLVVSYGLSESTCTSTMNPPQARRIGTIGTVLSGQEIRLFHASTTNEVASGSEGEICISGPCLMLGYLGAGVEQPVHDGWLRTGDVGCFDADGYLRITGRIKDVIIRGGENIYCAELERVFQEFPGVLEVAAFGVPDDRWGERAVLAVVPQPDTTLSADEMRAFGATKLAGYKIPSEIVFTETPFVRNAVGKIDKPILRRGYA